MNKPIIAVDIDEVLSPLHDLVFAHHNAVYGTSYPIRDHENGLYYLDQYSDETHDVLAKKIERYVTSAEFQQAVKPLEGAVEIVKELTKNFTLVIVTSRQDFYYDFTQKWLAEHFPDAFEHIVFTEYTARKGVKVAKSEICKQLGASYIIEDNLEHATECAEAGINTVLFGDYPWNQSESLPAGMVRAKDWQAVKEYFDAR